MNVPELRELLAVVPDACEVMGEIKDETGRARIGVSRAELQDDVVRATGTGDPMFTIVLKCDISQIHTDCDRQRQQLAEARAQVVKARADGYDAGRADERAERADDASRGKQPPITHVAVRFRDQIWSLPAPYRHHDVFSVIRHLNPGVDCFDGDADDQGFLDASGRYLRLRPALMSAQMNDQIKNGHTIGSILTSEDLW